MGWRGALAYDAVFRRLPPLALIFMIAGGILYTTGVIFHFWDRLPFQNAIWRAFVVAAAAFQYAAVFSVVLPGNA